MLNELNYQYQFIQHYASNKRFQKNNPLLILPPKRELYETFQLNFQLYQEDGFNTALEIIELYKSINLPLHTNASMTPCPMPHHTPRLLDWGCGTARVVQFMPQLLPPAICYGADINSKRIEWNRKYFTNILFDIIEDNALPYPTAHFNLVYGISVFTHIHHSEQEHWLKELQRILTEKGIAIVSTHGSNYYGHLNSNQLSILAKEGAYTNNYKEKGHRLMTTYNNPNQFRTMAEKYFEILEYYNGKTHPAKLGGQDVWVLRRR